MIYLLRKKIYSRILIDFFIERIVRRNIFPLKLFKIYNRKILVYKTRIFKVLLHFLIKWFCLRFLYGEIRFLHSPNHIHRRFYLFFLKLILYIRHFLISLISIFLTKTVRINFFFNKRFILLFN